MSKLKIICLGANIETKVALKGLVEYGIEIVGVITGALDQERRGSDYRDLKPFCALRKIPMLRVSSINSKEAKAFIKSTDASLMFILGWSQILDDEILSLVKVYGSHPSKLPYGAGRAPVPWTVLENNHCSALSIFEVVKDVDAGNLVYQHEFDLPIDSSSNDLYMIVAEELLKGFVSLYDNIVTGNVCPIAQNLTERTVRAKRFPCHGKIDFSMSAAEVLTLIRATTEPYPGAYSFFNGIKVIIWKSEKVDQNQHKGSPGQILMKKEGKLLVQCVDSPVWVYDFTTDEGEEIEINSFPLGASFGVLVEEEVLLLKDELNLMRSILKENGLI